MKVYRNQTRTGRAWLVLMAVTVYAGILPLQVSAQGDNTAEAQLRRTVAHRETALPQKWTDVLSLTQAQRQQAKPIQADKARQIQQVLTAEQNQRMMAMTHYRSVTKYDLLAGLKLTSAQSARRTAISEQIYQQSRTLEQNRTLSKKEHHRRFAAILQLQTDARYAFLTPEQKLFFSQFNDEMSRQSIGFVLTPEQRKRNSEVSRKMQQQSYDLYRDKSLSKAARANRIRRIGKWGGQQFQQLLTSEQHKQFDWHRQKTQAINEGGYYGMPMLEMLGDLTDAQRQQIKAISGESDSQFQQLLTEEQKQKHNKLTTGITVLRRSSVR